jgi:hypothetical protein
MNYQQVVDTLLAAIDDHLLINQSGYGNLSDIHTPESERAPDYPYAFLNPTSVSVGDSAANFQFNLVIMDQVIDGENSQAQEIFVQSNCIMYLQDIISRFRETTSHPLIDITVNVTATPFKERFEDNVAGVGAQITVQAGIPLDGCDAAYA